MTPKRFQAAVLATVLFAPTAALSEALDIDFYGSLRLQGEAVDPDGASSYTGFRDAFSRIGFRASAPITDRIGLFAQLELPRALRRHRS